ncbi:tRNA (cytidine(34)-2'-O)-methyltransferase [Oceanicella actignis]|uniref:tRNA (cytidine(34)-2'-O)-methyltransferase n=1 Tax=Oceanicella actignis TaxID=1189325 RepID=A0A1M7T9K2_9RHOB|nr:TrmH family RNA methyltransferase [Oceanicella actignis]TYO89140.1 tRNA (cytidine/uridine-2'-O-)-methyltransferase [Oceanicella actignis]SET51109.1 tRNA (cytidine/uridine-2'-O-)-methyltransferase [Oceanicella actignis]SHN67386.1 tRNA (cytidine/uridine-2'-O-)-methyltransferase [Oceanicella actignis]
MNAARITPPPLHLAAFQPDMAHNLGAMIRLAACFGTPLHVIEPCGFPFSVKAVRQRALDYADIADIRRWDGWRAFAADRPGGRLVLLTTRGAQPLWSHRFAPGDVLIVGRESAGAPPELHEAADARLFIPMPGGGRSLNVAMAAGIALAEGARQLSRAP